MTDFLNGIIKIKEFMNIDIKNLKAKSYNGISSSTIISHSLATARLSVRILDNWLLSKNIMNRTIEIEDEISDIKKVTATAAMLHDVGKCTDDFQKKLKKENCVIDEVDDAQPVDADWKNSKSRKQQYFRHNVVSWALAMKFVNFKSYKFTDKILSAILYHHIVYQRDLTTDGHKSSTAGDVLATLSQDELRTACELIKELSRISSEEFGTTFRVSSSLSTEDRKIEEQNLTVNIVNLSETDAFMDAARYTIIRTVLIYADRMLAEHPELENEILTENYDRVDSLISQIDVLEHADELKNFDTESLKKLYDNKRLDMQLSTLEESMKFFNENGGTFNLSASAGWGKTLFGILYTLLSGKKTIWVLPINLIADGTYRSITREIEVMGLQDKLSVGLYMSGKYVHGNENSDILIMIIDSFLAPLYRNTDAHLFIRRLGCNIIMDEYHEFFTSEPLFAGFINTMYARNWYTDSRTLLMSATPRNLPVFDLFLKYGKYTEYRPEPYNGQMKINIKFVKVNNPSSLDIKKVKDAFVIMPMISAAQEVFVHMKSEKDDILHSKFKKFDRKEKEKHLYTTHDKMSGEYDRNVFYGTHILITGNDISANNIFEVPMTPDKTIQAVFGRCGRYNESFYNGIVNYYVVEMTDKNYVSAITELRNQMFSDELTKKWIESLRQYDGKVLTKDELYSLWENFYRDNHNEVTKIENSFIRNAYRDMYVMRPYATRKRNDDEDNNKILPSKPGWRGENTTIFAVLDSNFKKDEDIIKIDLSSIEFLEGEWNYDSKKKKINFMMRRIPNFKYIFRNGRDFGKEELLKYAKCENTPLLLTTFVYRSDIGLVSSKTLERIK